MKNSLVNQRNLILALMMGAVFILGGCAFGHFGKADVTWQQIKAPANLLGMTKTNVIKSLGVPDVSYMSGNSEIMAYHNNRGFYILLYGETIDQDLVLELKGGKVDNVTLLDKGRAVGIFCPPGGVTK